MDAVRLGPLVVPVQVALLLAGVMLANVVTAWFHRKDRVDAGPVLWKLILIGFAVGRLVFVLRHHDIYFNAPLSIIDFRDGGFDEMGGFAAAAIAGIELTRRSATSRRPILIAAIVGCLVFFGGGALNAAFTPSGMPVPALTVRRLDNTTVPLSVFVGRPLIINLWATWCPPCRREMPILDVAQRAHPEIHFVFVNQGESLEAVNHYLNTIGLKMQNVVLDPGRQLSARTSSSGYPTTLFYDAKGRLYKRHVGELSTATLREVIDALIGSP